MTEKDRAFELFDEGKTASSPEVKALKLKGKTRYNYYLEWQKAGGAASPSPKAISESKAKGSEAKGKTISELEMLAPREEVKEEEVKGEGPETSEPKQKMKAKPTDGKKPPPTMVAGQGLTFAITLSTKTLMLYQIAASQQEEELTLGDFIDACVEDTYQGRGLDLGLVKIGGA